MLTGDSLSVTWMGYDYNTDKPDSKPNPVTLVFIFLRFK